MFLVDAGLGTPKICMQDEPTGVPINRATRFENKVGFLDLVAGESLIKEQILERFFIDLVAKYSDRSAMAQLLRVLHRIARRGHAARAGSSVVPDAVARLRSAGWRVLRLPCIR
ncbi:hypothetical protein A4A49_52166 [Nicotiana attenuata]|uniref:Uncharacterized protein n=1 Tax=Nicotiana attenuata TaxID=49451 RepID=A0A1J6INN3_NICAT|nr:hypothetical protein A4A49_52166 [Nicotiana attenuata]